MNSFLVKGLDKNYELKSADDIAKAIRYVNPLYVVIYVEEARDVFRVILMLAGGLRMFSEEFDVSELENVKKKIEELCVRIATDYTIENLKPVTRIIYVPVAFSFYRERLGEVFKSV